MYILFPFDLAFKHTKKLDIMSIEETIQYVLNNNCSVARYGDGEFNMMSNYSIGFQTMSPELVSKLREGVSRKDCDQCLICLPGFFAYENEYEKSTRKFWNKILVHKRKEWYKLCSSNETYGNADITRCYIELEDKSKSMRYFQQLKKIWDKKSIIIVEGEKSRLGIGNDLFSNAFKISRILCPATNAYSVYPYIVESIKKYACKNELILLALGPTATVLAIDLCKLGYWAIDIGNIDKEYEWCCSSAKQKERNPIKFSMEIKGADIVEDCQDENYIKSIICKII